MKLSGFAVILLLLLAQSALSQVIRGGGNPYSSQLMTDPDAGTIQGIQRYGRPLATDPAQGSGYPLYVFPTVRDSGLTTPFDGRPTQRISPLQQSQLRQRLSELDALDAQLRSQQETSANQKQLPTSAKVSESASEVTRKEALSATNLSALSTIMANLGEEVSRGAIQSAGAYSTLAAVPASPVFIPGRGGTSAAEAYIRHQPLIQIKLRVVEVNRTNNLNVGSTLDYISNLPGIVSEISNSAQTMPPTIVIPAIPNVNGNQQNLTGLSRFSTPALNVNNSPSNLVGAGALVNLTSSHINLITSFLAEELNADVLTAPELVTTNGESVEFVAGTKSPFNLGTVNTNAPEIKMPTDEAAAEGRIQNHVFYKHVGTYLRITPRIVNYGSNATGRGDAPIVADDVRDWNLLINFMINERLAKNSDIAAVLKGHVPATPDADLPKDDQPHVWEPYTRQNVLVPLDVKTVVLERLNQFSRCDLRAYTMQRMEQDAGFAFEFADMVQDCPTGGCDWKPADCTIDLEVLARFSNKEIIGSKAFIADPTAGLGGSDINADVSTGPPVATAETGVRAVANIVQVRNGTGVVMAGLLGESDVETVAKIPVLGDLPAVGFLFRAKSVSRAKSEIVIFIEANILSDEANVARAQSGEDLRLARPYVAGGTLDNQLEVGLCRAGMGTYLPPATCEEQSFWEQHARRINRMKTTARDALR